MNPGDSDIPQPAGDLREQASAWFARMRRPDAVSFQAEFDRWLASDVRHLAAYNRISGVFSDAKVLQRSAVLGERPPPRPTRTSRKRVMATALALSVTIAAVGLSLVHLRPGPATPRDVAAVAPTRGSSVSGDMRTGRGEIRAFALADGSSVTLDTDSVLTVAFTPTRRDLRLQQGRARFSVAHEARPFVVSAGNGSVTAHGTVFDVAIDRDARVRVSLLRGSVEVALPSPKAAPSDGRVRRWLAPGEELAFDRSAALAVAPSLSTREAAWPQAMLDVDGAPLAQVLAEANRYSSTQLELGDAGLGGLKTSGRFRINDPDTLAGNLARLFNLEADRTAPGTIVLRRAPAR
ncbi:MAG: hypothetical protein JWN66_3263 [Sphingomonas bacterium]|uniref:FecR family protein n=1 Tax=Sphingomonas bacterium TaxID=1895847 RepID=UPI002608679A|nr:FecR domain-containing protein [Sphingomonas bacterium]MDB5706147.1 hypothetical protein [Sphingomonas bacterium]